MAWWQKDTPSQAAPVENAAETAADNPVDILADLPRGDPARAFQDDDPTGFKPPSDMFVLPDQLTAVPDLAYQAGSIFLGVVNGTMANAKEPRRRHVSGGHVLGLNDDRHMVTVAGSRAGKGRAAIVPNMLLYPGSVLATDPKGELATITARQRSEGLNQSVYVLDPFKIAKGNAQRFWASFNPIALMREELLVEDASLIADALVVKADKDPHWDESARTFIEGVILHVRTSPDHEDERSLVTVQTLIAEGSLEPLEGEDAKPTRSFDALEEAMRGNDACEGVIRAAAADFF
ncbi:type IV secretory system conjugative DNA transfer family protein, partial [Roseomonas sp. BN140053]|uniref:type IV secretory system conjugative DNA transfer family protein n=1 Tax=Roseomonas sp. BN140053 TaxID=3391898 RepID=UPI0039EA925D